MGKISGEEGWISLGPWGGKDGEYWTYKPDGPIMQISFRYGEVIDAIIFESKSNDDVVMGCSVQFGGSGGSSTQTFCIDSSIEQLSFISLTWEEYYGFETIKSLCFCTNQNKYGPFGSAGAFSVSIPIEDGVFTGFHGRILRSYIAAFGVFVAPKTNSLAPIQDHKGKFSGAEGWISLGPWGGNDGVDWVYKADGPIMQISIRYGEVIDSLLFNSKRSNGGFIGSFEKIGGLSGHTTKTFCIDSSVEQLQSVSFAWEEYYGPKIITSLRFNTNLNSYGPFGPRSSGSFVSIPIKGGVITGFHGRAGDYLNAIGIFLAPKVNSLLSSEKNSDSLHSTRNPNPAPTQLKGKISGEVGWISLGPWGGKDGEYWTYKPDGPIMQISVRYGDIIDSIIFESKSNDGVVMGCSVQFGGSTGPSFQTFCIDSSKEQLTSINLTWEDYYGSETIKSLCFYTNQNKYGPFGSGSGASSVSIPIEDGVFAGFHGRVLRSYIAAFGMFVAPKINRAPIQDHKGKISGGEGWISLGPWGGKDGVDWVYKADGPIMQISIHNGRIINSLLFNSKRSNGDFIGSFEKIGGLDGHTTETFCIDNSVEQLRSICLTWEDYYGAETITSLCFDTNLNSYGPFGSRSSASSVSIPIEGGVLTGFHGRAGARHGRAGTYINAIGIFLAPKVNSLPSSEEKFDSLHSTQDPNSAPTQLKGEIMGDGWISLGPWGGNDGIDWAYKPDGPIMQIRIWYGEAVNSIVFESRSDDGIVIEGSLKTGCTGGHATETFCIDNSVEQLSSISLTYGYVYGKVAIISLCFYTNLNKYGPFGMRSGAFSLDIPIEGGVIAGFHGRSGTYLNAIGIFVALAPKVNSLHSIQEPDPAPTQLKDKNSSEEGCISLGPWGGEDGVDWAYKYNGPIMQISISYGEAINSILFRSRSCDGLVIGSSQKVGSTRGRTTESFCIDSSVEQLSSISLTYGCINGKVTIISLYFCANLKEYGPFGMRSGISSVFIPIEGGVITGFHGRGGTYLNAIGIFVAPTPKVNSLFAIQDLDSEPTQLMVLGPDVGSKPKTLENGIHNAASSSSSVTTNKDDHRSGAPPPSSERIHKALQLLDMQISKAREKLQELQKLGGSERDFDQLGKAITKLMFQIPLTSTTKEDDHHSGALSPTSKLIRSNLNLLDTAFAEAKESMYHMNVEINQAHEKFKELQILRSSDGDSDEVRTVESDKKRKTASDELRKAIAKLNVQIHSNHKFHSADSKLHHKNWDNINGAEDGMMHFFHEETRNMHTSDCDGILKVFDAPTEPLRNCMLCFFKFPAMATIKRTVMIYLWIGQGYISQQREIEGNVEDVDHELAGKMFDRLINARLIEPIYQNHSLEPDSCRMSLSVRPLLYEKAEAGGFTSNGTLDLDAGSVCGDLIGHSCLINVGEAIINCEPKIFENMKHIRSLYLGRWQSSATHHIELADTKILHGLKKLKSLTFLSLRGISMMTELPKLITELNDLMILDLQACHNLSVIPNKIGLLKSLTHLDMSECYFLENMPKSLAQLSNLQVLKGFLIGDINKKHRSCTLRDLSGLQKLRKLNIYVSVKNLLTLQDLRYLEKFEGLKKLRISWGRIDAQVEDITEAFHHFATLPPRLQKLDLQCFPMTSLTNWLMPDKLKELKKLYIRGGKLRDLGEFQKGQGEKFTVEILRFGYLNVLDLYWIELRTLFPKLIYLHQVECPQFMNFPCDERGIWINKEKIDTHVQLQKYLRTSR